MSLAVLRLDPSELFRLLDVDASSSLDSGVRSGDKPKSLKTESTIELEMVMWR